MQGGVADYTRIIAENLSRRGSRVHVLTSTRSTSAYDDVIVHADAPDWRRRTLKEVKPLCKWIEPDVINIQYQTAAFEMRPAINLLPRMLNIPVVTTFHDLLVPYLFPKAGALRWQVNRILARESTAIITTNPEDSARLREKEHLERVYEIPIGSNIQPTLPLNFDRWLWRNRWELPQDAHVLCYFGFLNQSKGGMDLIRALGLLLEEDPNVHLLFIGGATGASDPTNADYASQIRRLVVENRLNDHVHWTGHISDEEVSAAFACSDICVLPFQDGVSIRRGSLMAALVHDMPIVSTEPLVSTPGIVHGENIWLTAREQPQEIAQAVRHILQDHVLRQKLSDGARELAKQYDWDNITTRILEVYGDALLR